MKRMAEVVTIGGVSPKVGLRGSRVLAAMENVQNGAATTKTVLTTQHSESDAVQPLSLV